ncbi:unnamed protein product [Clonostachys chloroleuca]|uniref:Autophagy-related protein 14 n=1 Tax=Clonostachys chloroleuca TaxID=1926264 RepID=A0AA35M585_9HYPO|nr:unnamed protein product [Clonostachys chloroleuca]
MSTLSEPRRPRLLPQNRKLRHLKGLSLRNLCFAPAHRQTTDDAVIGRSPHRAKLEALHEAGSLFHSRSSEHLRPDALRSSSSDVLRPPKTRRTSLSLGSTQLNLQSRQKKLEELVEAAVGDVFFTLHVADVEDPVYISEVCERSANFDFQFFDLSNRQPSISRTHRLTIRLWAKRPKDAWSFLLEEIIDLRQLNFIGSLLDRRYPPNALVFHLEDGVYSFDFPNKISDPKQIPPIPTSSYNALMKLANLESSIEDAIETQKHIMHQINNILQEDPPDSSDMAQEDVKVANAYVSAQQRANAIARRKRDELRESLANRRAAIAKGREQQAEAEEDIANNRQQLEASKQLVEQTERQIHGQRRRICSELSEIFPITPIPNAPPLSFQICNIPLPNSVYDATIARTISEDTLSAGLGLVTLLTKHLQFYLSHHIPYPLYPYGSRSSTRDDISHLPDSKSTTRDFPLYLPRGGSTTGQWRFEYAWFLLNKDIEALCASQGLKVVDIRHSLPNLKYLLYVCSAGSEDVPERKKGGVRGLWLGRLMSRNSLAPPSVDGESSRRGSTDSQATLHPQGDVLHSPVKENGASVEGLSLPFAESDVNFTLRTKGLRENVA